MNHEDARRVLDEIGVVRHRADLDLLLFFVRHPRTLLTSEQIAAFLGYDLSQVAHSLDLLLESRLLTRTQNRSNHAARLYVFAADGSSGGWLPLLRRLSSTREGRLALVAALAEQGSAGTTPGPAARHPRHRAQPRQPRPFLVRPLPDATPGSKAG